MSRIVKGFEVPENLVGYEGAVYVLNKVAIERFKQQKKISNRHGPKYIIALMGDSGSGKTHSAEHICKQTGATKMSFADPLKKIAREFGFEHRELYGTQIEKEQKNAVYGISGREFMQKFGTEVCQQDLVKHLPTMNNVWAKLAMKKIADEKLEKVVFDDLRFVQEADELNKHTCFFLRIYNEMHCEVHKNAHISATEFRKIDTDIQVNVEFGNYSDVDAAVAAIESAYKEVYGQ